MKTGAFFDLDDTIMKGNSGIRAVLKYFLSGKTSLFYSFRILYGYCTYYWFKADPYKFFQSLYVFMKGGDFKTETESFTQYFNRKLKRRIYQDARKLIEWHKKRGHIVAIVTNSLDIMIGNIKEQLKVDYLIASALEVKNGKFTGKTSKVNFGVNKVKNIRMLAKKLNIDLKKSYAYSDNNSDIPFLSAVGNPVATNPQRKMKRFAKKMNWKILFFKDIGGQ